MRLFILKIIFIPALMICTPQICLAAIEQATCDSLKSWAENYDAKQEFEPRPGVKINTIFQDETLIPIFNKSILEWERSDIKQLQGWLAQCRKQAYANKDKHSGEQFYAVIKSAKLASRSMRPIWSEQHKAAKRQKHEQIARDRALQKENIRQQNIAAQKTDTNSGRAIGPKNEQAAEEHQSLLDQVNSVSETKAGLMQLSRIAYRTDTGSMSREQRESYNQAFQYKRRIINANIAEQEAKAKAEAQKPIDLSQRLSWLIQGSEIEDLSIGGLRPGMSRKEIVAKLRKDWGFESSGTTLDSSIFTGKSKDEGKYISERRNGGAVTLSIMEDDELGQLTFEERYFAIAIPAQVQRRLSDKLGEPDKVQPGGGGVFMMWKDGDYRLQVFVTNQLEVVWKGAGYKSRLALSYWHEDFEDHLEQVNKRCNKLKSKGRNQWSINDATFFTMQCNLSSQPRKPGL